MKEKLLSVQKLLASRIYILITDKEAVMQGDFKGFDGFMRINALKAIRSRIDELLAKWQREEVKKNDGRNKTGRPKSSPNNSKS